jgi:deoxyribodipyrimidine photo-lyase
VCQRWTEPFGRERDRRIEAALAVSAIRLQLTDGETLAPPASLRTSAGRPYTVFTPFSRAFAEQIVVDRPLPAPRRLPPPPPEVAAETVAIPTLESLGIALNPRILPGGEAAGRARLAAFLDGPARRYDHDRDRLDRAASSRLSVDLKFGTVSPRTAWRAVADAAPAGSSWRRAFLAELVWRELAYATLWDRPDVLEHAFRRELEDFPYIENDAHWEAWVAGKTGYPVVDAAARQLLGEGFVHNRARMIAASFLTKHLLIDWRRGYAHYLAWLTDGDWAQNSAGWQWTAGCGCDAQPWFRVFNPVAQGERFDPDGAYVRAWVPELARLPARFIHRPWEAPGEVLRAAGVVLGATYPRPIVDHATARARFLSAAKRFRAR